MKVCGGNGAPDVDLGAARAVLAVAVAVSVPMTVVGEGVRGAKACGEEGGDHDELQTHESSRRSIPVP